MSFLLLRLLPYLAPLAYFISLEAVFTYSDQWPWLFGADLILALAYFGWLKYKNRSKPVVFLALFGLIFAATGIAYALILENYFVINAFIVGWSLIYLLYLEAVFHDFYDTDKTYILDLKNITLYGSILVIFFLTASLTSFSIFLSLPAPLIVVAMLLVFACLSYLTFLRQGLRWNQAWLYAGVISLILTELYGVSLLLPVSFYVIAAVVTLAYYLSLSLALSALENKLDRRIVLRYLIIVAIILIAVLATATWF